MVVLEPVRSAAVFISPRSICTKVASDWLEMLGAEALTSMAERDVEMSTQWCELLCVVPQPQPQSPGMAFLVGLLYSHQRDRVLATSNMSVVLPEFI